MEKSIKRVEKLVHDTNLALAQMKYSLTFDDLNEEPGLRFLDRKPEDLGLRQGEFRSEVSQMKKKLERLFGSYGLSSARHAKGGCVAKSSETRDKIKEINRRLESLRLNKEKSKEAGLIGQKLPNFSNEEESKSSEKTSSRGSMISQPAAFREDIKLEKELTLENTDSLLALGRTPSKPREELKSKILETQEIVDRGCQTARQLIQKVEMMTIASKNDKKSPCSLRTASEINFRCLETSQKSGSNVNIKDLTKCKHLRKKRRKGEEVNNNRVVVVRRAETQRRKCSNLRLQRLPSIHIKGELQLQKVHNLEILPENVSSLYSKPNTAINVFSHEEIEKEKADSILEEVKKKQCCEGTSGNLIQCFNCGKLIRVPEGGVDSRKLDEMLQRCNFNVFDPRIDEFVEKHSLVPPEEYPKEEQSRGNPLKLGMSERTFKIQHLSEQLSRQYKKEANSLEDNHLRLNRILQKLFEKVEESRVVFEDCQLLSNKQGTRKLTITKPVVMSWVDDGKKSLPKKVRKMNKAEFKYQKKSSTTELKLDIKQPEVAFREEKAVKILETANEVTIPAKEHNTVSTSENSENDYESDFEGYSDLEDLEEEPFAKKLTTISELDSELEKKFSDNDTLKNLTPRIPLTAVETSNTAKIEDGLRKASQGAFDAHTSEAAPEENNTLPSQKSTPTELVTSLKDILSALKDQFARTESLAEKLTENAKGPVHFQEIPPKSSRSLGNQNPKFLTLSLGQVARKEAIGSPSSWPPKLPESAHSNEEQKSGREAEEGTSEASIEISRTDEGGSSVGELLVNGGRNASEKSEGNSISECTFMQAESERSSGMTSGGERKCSNALKLMGTFIQSLNSEEILYSEGEIPSNVLGSDGGSALSVGEVLKKRDLIQR